MRGKLVRMRMRKIRQFVSQQDEMTGVFDPKITDEDFLFNEKVKEVYESKGPFETPTPSHPSAPLVIREPFRMKNGVIYAGQWTTDLKTRTGIGRLVWLDGSLYEGQWING